MNAIPLRPAHTFKLRMLRAVLAELAPYKQRQIALELGVTEARVSQIMSGDNNLTLETIQELLMVADWLAAKEPPQ